MAGCILKNRLKKIALGSAIVLAVWSVVAAQQTTSSKQAQPTQVKESVGLPPKMDQLKDLRTQAEASKDLSESDKKSALSLLDRGIRSLKETERLNTETQQFIRKVQNAPTIIKEIE